MAEDIHLDIDYDSMRANDHLGIIREAFRLRGRIELIGLKVSKIHFKYGQRVETKPKISCRNRKQDFIIIQLGKVKSAQEGKVLVMLLMALGKVCDLPQLSVDVLFKDSSNQAISTKHKRGTLQAKFEKELLNENLMNQLSLSSNDGQNPNLTRIQSDLIVLTVNGRIGEDAATQYCEATNTTHEELWYSFIELRDNLGYLPEEVPQELVLPSVPFEEYIEAIDSIYDGLCDECLNDREVVD